MMRLFASILVAASIACGGQTAPTDSDAGSDAAPDVSAPINECHGYCPQPNGSLCTSDCDCYDKCLGGTDKPARCGDPVAPTVPCDEAGACPAGQTCGTFGGCEGMACGSTDDCPSQQTCMAGKCAIVGCI
ncbi:MAG TPA: hypothetical protein VGH28_29840 [Polyangiaceae bacterium]